MDRDFRQFLNERLEQIQSGTAPLLDSAQEILREIVERMKAGDKSAFEAYAGILKVLAAESLPLEREQPGLNEALLKWVTQSATEISRPDVTPPADLLSQLTEQLQHVVSGLRDLENLQNRITRNTAPVGSGLETGVASRPKSTISGDFIDIFAEGDWTWIVVGDAAGHGLPAAFYANTVFPVLRSFLKQGVSILESVQAAHAQLHRYKPDEGMEYAVAHVCAWNRLERRFHLVNAGVYNAMPIIVLGGMVRRIALCGSQLGLIRNASFDVSEVIMSRGDLAIFVSDGITEQSSTSGKAYGEDRLSDLIALNTDLEPVSLAQRILADALAYGDDKPDDDMTVLVVRF